MKEFEVGDIVKAVDEDGRIRVGEVVFRDECPEVWGEEGLYVVKFNNDEYDTEWYTPEKMDHLKNEEENTMTENKLTEPIKYTSKYLVGDRVRVVAAISEEALEYIGQVGTVKHINPSGYSVDLEDRGEDEGLLTFNEAEIVFVQRGHEDFSDEYEALAFLLRHEGPDVRRKLRNEMLAWAKHYLSERDYKNSRRAIDLTERIEKKMEERKKK